MERILIVDCWGASLFTQLCVLLFNFLYWCILKIRDCIRILWNVCWTFCCHLLIGELGATLLSLHPYGIIFMLTVLLWEVLMFNICDSVIFLFKSCFFFFFGDA